MPLFSNFESALSVADEHSPFATNEAASFGAGHTSYQTEEERDETAVSEGESGPSVVSGGIERAMLVGLIAFGQRDANWLTDQIFYTRHPELRGQKLRPDQRGLAQEWSSILHDLVQPALGAPQPPTVSLPSPGKHPSPGQAGGKKADALRIADTPVPDQPGVTIRQLVERWRPSICAEVPIEVLLAFLAYEPGRDLFRDATHGTARNHWTSPDFYELGLFQTPAGQHGVCTSGEWSSCSNRPPGIEKPRDRSTWSKLCENIGANPDDWTNPTTQVRVGLLDLEQGAEHIRHTYPELFRVKGSDWDLRMAVLYPFAHGGGAARFFLDHFRKDLAALPESARWGFLHDKSLPVTAHGQTTNSSFAPENVDEKMTLAAELGYAPKSDAETIGESSYDPSAAETESLDVESNELDSASNEFASVDPASNEYRSSFGLPELEFDAIAEEPRAEFDTATFHRLADVGPNADQVMAAAGIAAGHRDPNSLADFVFYFHHPELKGTRIQAGQTALIAEWRQIRDTIAQPALAKLHDAAPSAPPTAPVAAPGAAPTGSPDAVLLYDGRSPAPGTVETRRSFPTNPPIMSDRSNRNATRYANVINQFAVAVNPRYKTRTNPQTKAVSTYCNIFCWDVTRAMDAEVPHWVDTNGDPTPHGVGNELNANAVYDWLHYHGSRHGWRRIATQEEAQQLANAGHPVIAAMKAPHGIGHVAVIRPGELNAQGPAMAQAGSENYNNTRLYGIFRRTSAVELWAND